MQHLDGSNCTIHIQRHLNSTWKDRNTALLTRSRKTVVRTARSEIDRPTNQPKLSISTAGKFIMAGAASPRDRIRNTAKALESSARTLMADLHNTIVMTKLIAEDLEREKKFDEVEKLGKSTLELISSADHMGHYAKALDSLAGSYNINEEATDFKKFFEKQATLFEKNTPSEPENHVYYNQFKEAIWNVHHAGEPMQGQELEDIVMTTSQYGILNTTCPLTGKPVTELKEPVRSADCRHIYEREIVMVYIKNHSKRQPCKCAAAGCPRTLVESSMVCDPSLPMEIQELRIRGQVSSQAHMVADCTELDEDEI